MPAKWKDFSTNQKSITSTTASDGTTGWGTNIVGIVQSGGGTTGQSLVCYAGVCECLSTGAGTVGDYVSIDPASGKCISSTVAGVNENPETNSFFGKVYSLIDSTHFNVSMMPVS